MRKDVFAVELNKTAAVFRTELNEALMAGYWEAFSDQTDDGFTGACKRARVECDFFPTIKELRRFLPVRPPPVDPLVTRLLTPWEPQETWPPPSKPNVDKRKKAAAHWEPKNEMERRAKQRFLDMKHEDFWGGWWVPADEPCPRCHRAPVVVAPGSVAAAPDVETKH